jgi:protein ImuB
MRRVVSIWLPSFPTDRLRRCKESAPAPDVPFVTAHHDGRRRVVAAADRAALAAGVRPGMALAQAEILAPGLVTAAADPAAEEKTLRRLAAWCLRYAPLAAIDLPDGLWIDAAGCTHLFDGETAVLADIRARLAAAGFSARASIADTPGAAHALARHGKAETILVPPGGQAAALAPLPPASLRLPEEAAALLTRLGITRIDALAAMPRGPLTRRFGAATLHRLDQALGRAPEPITPLPPPGMPAARMAFSEPLVTTEAFFHVISELAEKLCQQLERSGKGARRLDLLFERIDGVIVGLRIGTARPSRDARHLARLLQERLEEVDPGLGVEAMRLQVPLAEQLGPEQTAAALAGEGGEKPDLAVLVDRLANCLGSARLYRAAPVESDVPERSVGRVLPLAPVCGKTWPLLLPRPARLLSRPEPVRATALLPDHPPVQFVWRGRRHRLAAGDGPERVFGEWWRNDTETFAVRDYFRVEDESGRRYWLFRRGDGADPATGDRSWFLHGFF